MLHTAPSAPFMILAFIALLGPLVTIHELGHYLVGRWCSVKAEVFSIGFGREIVGWTDRRGTRWKLSMIPLGGYVRFAGDADATSRPVELNNTELNNAGPDDAPEVDRRHWFSHRPLWQRALVVFAGPAANFLLAAVIFAAFNLAYGHIEASPVIAEFTQSSPAHDAGLMVGDRIVAIDGNAIDNFEQIREAVFPIPGETLAVTARRGQQQFTVPIQVGSRTERDEYGNESRIGMLGISAGRVTLVHTGLIRSVGLAFGQCLAVMHTEATGLRQIVTGTRSVKEMGGPVKIARYSGEQLALGWRRFVYFVGMISINLAFINLLPVPTLDGGHLLFYAAEAIRRKPASIRSQEWAFRMGLACVLALMVFVTINDVASLPIFGGRNTGSTLFHTQRTGKTP